jgi:ligand-binding sensor domain-containing protein/DNA-binding NarL/FixJ family response regulator
MKLERGQLVPVADGSLFREFEVTALLPYSAEEHLLVTASKGLFLMSSTGIVAWDTPASDFVKEHFTYCAIQLAGDKYAIGTTQNGLLIMGRDGSVHLHLNRSSGLQNNTVLSLYEDHHRNLFLGLDNGVDYIELNSPFTYIRSESGVEGTGYTSFVQDGSLYLGTNQGLFTLDWDTDKSVLPPLSFQLVPNAEGQVWSLQEIEEHLIVGQHKGAQVIRNGRAVPFSRIQGAWKFMPLQQHPNYAVEGTYNGLILYQRTSDPNDVIPWKMMGKLEGFDESARVMEEDRNGHLWISHAYKGVYKVALDVENQKIREVSFFNSEHGLPADIAINVAKIRGELIFTTPAGIYYFDEDAQSFQQHTEFTEIFGGNRNIHRLVEDEIGNIWFSVDQEFGVLLVKEQGLYNKLDQRFFNHVYEDLMEGYEQVFAYDRNHLFIATEQGFIHYHPSTTDQRSTDNFRVLIREVAAIEEHDSTLFSGYFRMDTIEDKRREPDRFPSKMNDFQFVFSATFFEQLEEVQYRYRLKGFQEEWSDWTAQGKKEYTNLPYGTYQFMVEAQNAFGDISTAASYRFVIRPPWYASLVARIGYFVLALAGIGILLTLNGRRWRKRTEELKNQQAQALKEKKEEYQQRVEKSEAEIIYLRNEKLRADLALKNSKLASAAMHLVQKGEILQKIKRDLKKIKTKAVAENQDQIRRLIRAIDEDLRVDDHWDQFELYFDQVHEDFLKRLREQFPMLTPKDQKLCAYLRMNLTTKEIAPLMNISVRGIEISRYRLRKKLELDSDTNLNDFMIRI